MPLLIWAHGGHGSGFMAGLTHPILGLDHLLAIFAMGLYAKQNFRDNTWPIIFSFVLAMIIGGLIGVNAEPFPFEETVIIGSVLLYGLMLGVPFKISKYAFIGLGFIIALFHGHAHGVEIPAGSSTLQYVPGFAIGALVIAGFGEFVGRHLDSQQIGIVRFIGGFIFGMGLMSVLT